MSTLIVGIFLAAVVALVVRNLIKNKAHGKSSCGCGCSSCGSGCNCSK
ncbi:FeoB-associated Cys-rich membrane protein [Treponema sp. JC4]|nr:FeoB-associated Cys-rich membrane protein [Treponema sp. JC4]